MSNHDATELSNAEVQNAEKNVQLKSTYTTFKLNILDIKTSKCSSCSVNDNFMLRWRCGVLTGRVVT